jgi:hypothetical protein
MGSDLPLEDKNMGETLESAIHSINIAAREVLQERMERKISGAKTPEDIARILPAVPLLDYAAFRILAASIKQPDTAAHISEYSLVHKSILIKDERLFPQSPKKRDCLAYEGEFVCFQGELYKKEEGEWRKQEFLHSYRIDEEIRK